MVATESGERTEDELLLIYPTPQKEADTLGYPYSEMFRWFGMSLAEPETALLSIGYSYSDEHLNRLVYQALASNPTLQFLLVDPHAIAPQTFEGVSGGGSSIEIQWSKSKVAALAQLNEARISLISGEAGRFVDFSTNILPDPDAFSGPAEVSERTQTDLAGVLLEPPTGEEGD